MPNNRNLFNSLRRQHGSAAPNGRKRSVYGASASGMGAVCPVFTEGEGKTRERDAMMKTMAATIVASGLALTVTAGQPGLTEPGQVLPRDAIPAINHPRVRVRGGGR